MTCHNCRIECRKFGKTRKGQQRYRCCQCYKTYSNPCNEHLGGMYTAPEKVEGVINLLVEGCSIRSIQRLTGIDQNTIMKILVLAGDRQPAGERVTTEDALLMAESLKQRNEGFALSLANSAFSRFFFRYMNLRPDFGQIQHNPGMEDVECLAICIMRELSTEFRIPYDAAVS